MALHRDLTGADLHEPKGVATAGLGTTYVANGAGSGSWTNVKINQVDSVGTTVISEFIDRITVTNINETKTNYFVMGKKGVMFELRAVVNGVATVDTTVTLRKNASTPILSFLIPANAPIGTVFAGQPSPSVPFDIGDTLSVETNGSGTAIAPLNSILRFAYQY